MSIILNHVMEYALNKLIESLGNKDDESSNMIRESATRAKALVNHIRIYNINYIGLTYEDFVKQLEDKPNIYLLSNKEIAELENLIKLNTIITNHGLKIINKS